MTDRVDLDELDALEREATPRPWYQMDDIDGDFLVPLRNAYPALSTELRQAREQNARMRETAHELVLSIGRFLMHLEEEENWEPTFELKGCIEKMLAALKESEP